MAKMPDQITVQLDPEVMDLLRGLLARIELLEAHSENLIERVYALEGGDDAYEDARLHLAWTIWCIGEGYRAADRVTMTNWMLEDTLNPEDQATRLDMLAAADDVLLSRHPDLQ